VTETVLLATTVLISTLYHICQVEWACFGMDLRALQISDHVMVFFALIWFLLYAAGSTERVRTAVSIALIGVLLPVIISHLDTWIAGIVVTSIAVVAFVCTFVWYASVRKAVYVEWRAFAVAIVLIMAGVSIHVFAGDFGPDNTLYPIAHTVWHVLAFVSLYYIAAIPSIRAPAPSAGTQRRIPLPRLKNLSPRPGQFSRGVATPPAAVAVARPPPRLATLNINTTTDTWREIGCDLFGPPPPHIAASRNATAFGAYAPPPPPRRLGQGTYLTLDADPSVFSYHRGEGQEKRT
jgi:hypothetical protein